MIIEFTYNDGSNELFENVSDFYYTENKYIMRFNGSNSPTTININDVKHYKKL